MHVAANGNASSDSYQLFATETLCVLRTSPKQHTCCVSVECKVSQISILCQQFVGRLSPLADGSKITEITSGFKVVLDILYSHTGTKTANLYSATVRLELGTL